MSKAKRTSKPRRRRSAARVTVAQYNRALLHAAELQRKLWQSNALLAAVVKDSGGALTVTEAMLGALKDPWHLVREDQDGDQRLSLREGAELPAPQDAAARTGEL